MSAAGKRLIKAAKEARVMKVETTLPNKMYALIERRGEHALPDGFKKAAKDLNKAIDGYFGVPQTCEVQKFIGAFAHANRLYREATGDSLL